MMVSKVSNFAAIMSTAIIRINAVTIGHEIASLMISSIPTFSAHFLPPTWSMMYFARLMMMFCATSPCIWWTMRSICSRWGETPMASSFGQSSISCTLYSMVSSCMPYSHSSHSSIPRNSKCSTKCRYNLMLHAVKASNCLCPALISLMINQFNIG